LPAASWQELAHLPSGRREQGHTQKVARRNSMDKKVGLWFDFDKAVIVSITDNGEEIKRITSAMRNYVRFSKNIPGDGSPEDARDTRFWNHMSEYYDQVIAHIHGARVVQIFGPGEAKFELKKRLEARGQDEHIEVSDTTDKLTDLQIAIRVRTYFPVRSLFDLS
jgi:hypothetical protein